MTTSSSTFTANNGAWSFTLPTQAEGAYTLSARSPYSRGAITYSSSAPGVATVDAMKNRVVVVGLVREPPVVEEHILQTLAAFRLMCYTNWRSLRHIR